MSSVGEQYTSTIEAERTSLIEATSAEDDADFFKSFEGFDDTPDEQPEQAEHRAETVSRLVAHYGDTIFHYGTYKGPITQIVEECPAIKGALADGFDAVVDLIDRFAEPAPEEVTEDDTLATKEDVATPENEEKDSSEEVVTPPSVVVEVAPVAVPVVPVAEVATNASADSRVEVKPEIPSAKVAEPVVPIKKVTDTKEPMHVAEEHPAKIGEPTVLNSGAVVSAIEVIPEVVTEKVVVEKPNPIEGEKADGVIPIEEAVELTAPVVHVAPIVYEANSTSEPETLLEIPVFADAVIAQEATTRAEITASDIKKQDEIQAEPGDRTLTLDQITMFEPTVEAHEYEDSTVPQLQDSEAESQPAIEHNKTITEEIIEHFEGWHSIANNEPPLEDMFEFVIQDLASALVEDSEAVQTTTALAQEVEVVATLAEENPITDAYLELELQTLDKEELIELFTEQARPEYRIVYTAILSADTAIQQLFTAKTKEECALHLQEVKRELSTILRALGFDNPEKIIVDYLQNHSPESLKELVGRLEYAFRLAIYREIRLHHAAHSQVRHTRLGKFVGFIMQSLSPYRALGSA